MRRTVLQTLTWVLVLGMVAALALTIWLVVSWFLGLPPSTQTPVAALTGVVLVPIITFITTRSLERRRLLEAALREKKTALYDEMVKGLMGMLNLGNSSKKVNNTADIMKLYQNITPRLISYGSRGVIKAWTTFRLGASSSPNPIVTMAWFEDLLKAMRKDLGHSTLTQPRGELLKLFINDIDTIDFKTMAYRVMPTPEDGAPTE